VNPIRDLHSLNGFDATLQRPSLGTSLARFRAASVLSELCLRFGNDDDTGAVFEAATEGFDAIAASGDDAVAGVALAAGWQVIAGLGFAPSLEQCALCHADLPAGAPVTFQHRAGGALCEKCARTSHGGRHLPAEARRTLAAWLAGASAPLESAAAARAHQRLLREFLEEHLGDGRPLRAFVAWEEQRPSPLAAAERV
jgi:DNA repair protein RecO (recombination protein O)